MQEQETTPLIHINSLLADAIEGIKELHDRDTPSVNGIPFGYVDLDAMTCGLHPGDLIVVAGRPSMGKTSFALNVAGKVAIEARMPAAVFSMGLSADQFTARMLSSVGCIDGQRLRTGRLKDDEWGRLSLALGQIYDAPIYFDGSPRINPAELSDRARKLKEACGPIGLIVVDSIQLMAASAKSPECRAAEISDIARQLKAVAKELNVPVIALSPLDRSIDWRPNRRPFISDLHESGTIEDTADVIILLYRDEVYNPDSIDRGLAEIIIGKQRNGPTGTVRMTFLGEYSKFENLAAPGSY